MFFRSHENKAPGRAKASPAPPLSAKHSWKALSRANKENAGPGEAAPGKPPWLEEDFSRQLQSKDSLFVDSEAEAPKAAFAPGGAGLEFRAAQLDNLFDFSRASPAKSPARRASASEKDTLSRASPPRRPQTYLERTRDFVRDCFQSISVRRSDRASSEGPRESPAPAADLKRLLEKYNRSLRRAWRPRICKRERQERFAARVGAFLRRRPGLRGGLLKGFRQSVESLPQLLHLFRPEPHPQLRRLREHISINQLSSLPRRNYQAKNLKSTIQLFCFKFYFLKMKKRPWKKSKYVAKLQRLTRMSGRQIYKWVWDEEKRFREAARGASAGALGAREQGICRSWARIRDTFRRKVRDRGLWIVGKIMLRSVGFFSPKVEKKIWSVKLKGLLQKSIFMDLSF